MSIPLPAPSELVSVLTAPAVLLLVLVVVAMVDLGRRGGGAS